MIQACLSPASATAGATATTTTNKTKQAGTRCLADSAQRGPAQPVQPAQPSHPSADGRRTNRTPTRKTTGQQAEQFARGGARHTDSDAATRAQTSGWSQWVMGCRRLAPRAAERPSLPKLQHSAPCQCCPELSCSDTSPNFPHNHTKAPIPTFCCRLNLRGMLALGTRRDAGTPELH